MFIKKKQVSLNDVLYDSKKTDSNKESKKEYDI